MKREAEGGEKRKIHVLHVIHSACGGVVMMTIRDIVEGVIWLTRQYTMRAIWCTGVQRLAYMRAVYYFYYVFISAVISLAQLSLVKRL